MNVVIDTNILISGTFFGGLPRKIIEAATNSSFLPCVNESIVQEYLKTVNYTVAKRKGSIDKVLFKKFLSSVNMYPADATVKICRDPGDDKFINCAIDAKAIYIVSGDKDLLTVGEYAGVEIVTARDFWERLQKNENSGE